MKRPPRRRDQTLVSNALIFFAYGYGPLIEGIGAFFAYYYVFYSYGIPLSDLWMSSIDHFQKDAPDFISNNQTFNVEQQMYMQRQACAAWQMAIVFGQLFLILCVRTRSQSIFVHGVFSNKHAIVAEIIAVALV